MERSKPRTGFKRRAALIAALSAAVVGVMVFYGMQSIERLDAVEKRWVSYNENATEGGRLLYQISRDMGYGGFIHNFKNFVLRRDLDYVSSLIVKRDEIYAALDKLETYVVTPEERNALDTLRAVFDKYAAAVPMAAEAFDKGLSSVEVDTLVNVDDAAAFNAISELNHAFLMRSRLAKLETTKALDAAASTVWLMLGVVPVIVVLGVTLILFLRRIMDANQNLSEVRDELTALLRQAPDAILHVDRDGRILGANDRAEDLFGYSVDELTSMHVEDLIPGRFRQSHAGIRSMAFAKMDSRPIGENSALLALTKDGEEVPVEISLNFMQSGRRRIATAIVRDVTERKRAEHELRDAHDKLEQRVRERTRELEQRTEELETEINERKRAETLLIQSAKMATIGEMASGITHELNQPMNVIRMGVEAAQIRIQRGNADMSMIGETLAKVGDQVLRMSDIINHMRVYSRQDTESRTPFDPAMAVREGCNLFTAQLSGADIKLQLNLKHVTDVRVLGHTTRLEQVMLNLLSNARDSVLERQAREDASFTGSIEVLMEQNPKRGEVIITVRDNGGGIPDEVLPHIFAPFVTTKESGQGTGLGLSVSYGIIEAMGGRIEVHNEGDGARFDITLPLADAVAGEAQDDAPASITVAATAQKWRAAEQGEPLKVLVVDDEIAAANSLSDFLQELGYLVYTAYNGGEAERIFDSDPVDVVITDLRMPVMDGEELIAILRRKAQGQDLPIFAMSGHSLNDGSDETVAGATEVWRKPLSLSEVAFRLRDLDAVAPPRPSA